MTVWTDQDVKTAADVPGYLRVTCARSVLDDFTGSPGQECSLRDLEQILPCGEQEGI